MQHAIHVCNHTTPEALYPFDARGIAKRFRHAAIFGALDALQPGETMRFCNDHDPLPLLAQLQQRYGERVRTGTKWEMAARISGNTPTANARCARATGLPRPARLSNRLAARAAQVTLAMAIKPESLPDRREPMEPSASLP